MEKTTKLKAQGYSLFMELESIRLQIQQLEQAAKVRMDGINRINTKIEAIEKANIPIEQVDASKPTQNMKKWQEPHTEHEPE